MAIVTLSACNSEAEKTDSGTNSDANSATSESSTSDSETPSSATTKAGPCALSKEQVTAMIGAEVTEVSSQGNWGIASTCTYSTADSPIAIEISSAASADLSGDRQYPGHEDISGVGDDAVWVPATRRLTAIKKSKGKLVRIGVAATFPEEQRLEIAKKIAELALGTL